jgi:hypothetical protein
MGSLDECRDCNTSAKHSYQLASVRSQPFLVVTVQLFLHGEIAHHLNMVPGLAHKRNIPIQN